MERLISIGKQDKCMKKEEYGHQVFILGNCCYRCSHKWVQREESEKPTICPSCKSPYWDKPKKRFLKNINKNSKEVKNRKI